MIVLYYDPKDYRNRGCEELRNLYHNICKIALKENNNQNVVLMPKDLELKELDLQELIILHKQLKHTIEIIEREIAIYG